MTDSLFIDIPKDQYAPGSTIRGTILWALERSPQELSLSLGWWTEGRGDKDAKVVEELHWETTQTSGEESFELNLPQSPYSFDGHLISLKWALELSVKKVRRPVPSTCK